MTPTTRSPAQTQAYLRQMLESNPLEASAEIVSLRAKFLGLNKPADLEKQDAYDDLQERREKTIRYLETIRVKFWDLDTPRLQTILAKLDIEAFPDLSHAVNRLKVVADHRDQLREFESHPHFDADFYSCLKKILVNSPRDTAALRDSVLLKLRDKKLHRRAKRMVNAFQSASPMVYSLESDWLDSIQTFRRKKAPPAALDSGKSGLGSPGVWIAGLAFFALIIIGFGIMSYFE